jgi:uncharacterized protein (DUF488 family)
MISKYDPKNLDLLSHESANPAQLSELAETERSRAKIHAAACPATAGPESANPAKLSELAETERSRAKIRFAFFFVASWIMGAVFRSESSPSP